MRVYSRHVLGFIMLSGTLSLWIASSVVVQAIFVGAAPFRKPIFLTLFNSAMSLFLLLPRITSLSSDAQIPLKTVGMLSATAGLFWLSSQFAFNLSLLHTSVATNTVLSSTSSMFTFVFSLWICDDPFRGRTFAAAVLSCLGCALVAEEAPQDLQQDAIRTSQFGDALTLTSAALFALASVLLRRLAPRDTDMGSYMGMNGLFSVLLAPGILYLAHRTGVETFQAPTLRTFLALAVNALIGCSLANYLYSRAVMVLSPVVANMFMCLSIPLSALVDEGLLGEHRFSPRWALGAAMVCCAVFGGAFDLESCSEEDLHKDLRTYSEDPEELESLLGKDA